MKADPGFLKLRKIRAAQQICKFLYIGWITFLAKTMSESQNRVYLPSNGLMLNIANNDYLKILEVFREQTY